MTLYGFWQSGSYIELNKVGGTGGSDSFVVEYKENMYISTIDEKEGGPINYHCPLESMYITNQCRHLHQFL